MQTTERLYPCIYEHLHALMWTRLGRSSLPWAEDSATIHCSEIACQEEAGHVWGHLSNSLYFLLQVHRWGWIKTDGEPHWTTLPEAPKTLLWIGLSLLQGCCSHCKCTPVHCSSCENVPQCISILVYVLFAYWFGFATSLFCSVWKVAVGLYLKVGIFTMNILVSNILG